MSCLVVRRRVRKTAVSSATLIEEFDSFLGEYFLVPPVYFGSALFFLIFNEFIYLSKKKKRDDTNILILLG